MLDLLCFTIRVAGVGSLAAPSGRWQRFRLAKEADGSLLGKQSEKMSMQFEARWDSHTCVQMCYTAEDWKRTRKGNIKENFG